MNKITWAQLVQILQSPVEYMGTGPVSTPEDMARHIDNHPFGEFSPNRTFRREASHDIILINGDGRDTYLQKRGKVFRYKNMVIIFGSDATVCYRVNPYVNN